MNALVLTAAGSSTRMGGAVKKEYLTLSEGPDGRESVLSRSLFAFLSCKPFSIVVITVPKDGEASARACLAEDRRLETILNSGDVTLVFAEGGDTRQASVLAGLEAIARIRANTADRADDLVLIHDAARPFVTHAVIEAVLETTGERGAAVPAIPPVDTEKEIDAAGKVTRHLDRSSVVAVQTPQGFLLDRLLEAHRAAALDGKHYTDDTEIWGRYAGEVWTCPGDRENRKITYKGDIA